MDSILHLETFLFLAILIVDWCFIWEHLNNFNYLVVLNRSVWTFVNLTGFSAVGRVMNPIIHHYVHIWPQKSNLSNSLRSMIHTYSSSKCGSHKINLSSLGVFALLCFSLVYLLKWMSSIVVWCLLPAHTNELKPTVFTWEILVESWKIQSSFLPGLCVLLSEIL